jgi:glutathione S-transferase
MGLARDARVRWALEEVGQPYELRLVSLEAKNEPAHLRIHRFGLIPTLVSGRSQRCAAIAQWSRMPVRGGSGAGKAR